MAMSDVLRRAIRKSGLGMLELARETGIGRQTLIRFMAGSHDVGLEIVADKLADYFELKLVHDGRTIRTPERKPPTVTERIQELLAKHPKGLTLTQIRDNIVATVTLNPRTVDETIYLLKSRGMVRHKTKDGVFTLRKRPRPCSLPAATNC